MADSVWQQSGSALVTPAPLVGLEDLSSRSKIRSKVVSYECFTYHTKNPFRRRPTI